MASVKTIFQLSSQPTWFENISIRSNGAVLATRLDVPEVWAIDPATSTGSSLIRLPLAEDDPTNALTGICELSPDIFAIGAGVYDMAGGTGPKPGSFSVWLADLTGDKPRVSKVADTPEIVMINGMATWDEQTALVTDCLSGKIYKLDISSGSYSIALEDETMTTPPNAPFPICINGIKVHRTPAQAYVYYTTTTRQSVYRLPVTSALESAGPAETLASGLLPDDLAVAQDGTVYVCTNTTNTVVRIPPGGGEAVTIAGGESEMAVAGSTSCVFGEGEKVLYVATAGGIMAPVDGKSEPAKIVEVRLG
ncbi:hypothetical protein G7Z17_g7438 [Cylindrodendrum hubeiense]|uniref:SMP-30/Gluconolactonase/LRE-like region domain-containing protein n=1 Tax=Cylindrodendrum hubeiense TaxID=595255 RepID=A0A9P5LFB2_9HYPO|nr:hypothetical protein G7Z17_g7438 [Cylindrodendrum hubeiense]